MTLVQCPYCQEIFDDEEEDMCPVCWTFAYICHDYSLGLDK